MFLPCSCGSTDRLGQWPGSGPSQPQAWRRPLADHRDRAETIDGEIPRFVRVLQHRGLLQAQSDFARWKNGICPETAGFSDPKDNDFVTSRIRKIAVMAGAPVAALPCKPNIHVYFASKPQELLDSIREHGGSGILTATPSKAKQIAIINSPIQAWYATGTRDEHNGILTIDNNDDNGWSGCICDIGPPPGPGVRVLDPNGTRAGSVHSELAHVLVIADVNQTKVFLIYSARSLTMSPCLRLTEIPDLRGLASSCQASPILAYSDCDDGPLSCFDEATDADIALFEGIYSVDPGEGLRNQPGRHCLLKMEKTLAAH